MKVGEGQGTLNQIVTFVKAELSLCCCSQRPLKGHESCMGAIVSEYFVLTAAHCFTVDDEKHSIKVSVGKDAKPSILSFCGALWATLPPGPTLPTCHHSPSLAC